MLISRRIAATLVVVGAATFFPAVIAGAQNTPPDDARERLHRRLTEEGERKSRAVRQPPLRRTSNSGIIQLPVDVGTGSKLFKAEQKGPGRAAAATERGTTVAARSSLVGTAPPPCPYAPINPYTGYPMKTASLLRVFPDVAWHVCVTDMRIKSLWVGPVHLRRTPSGPWITVLYQAGLADIFVPYHQTNFRPYDLRWTTTLDQITAQDVGANGLQVVLTNEPWWLATVAAEVRDRGVGWLCKGDTIATRRAQEFVVWGVADGGNYDNIVQYSFRDDGGMTFRMGNTGFNSPIDPLPTEPHTHNGLWRVDMDLNGAPNNTASLVRHREPFPVAPLQAQDDTVPFNVEGARQWDTPEFSTLLIEDAATNAFGNKLGYQFTPYQTGNSRQYGPNYESWTQNDYYVTAWHGSELGWISTWAEPGIFLLNSINGESASNNDLVVWVKASAHHHPADEDRSNSDLNTTNVTGVTLTHWSGFDVEPHNLFNANPLGGPRRCWNETASRP